MASVDVQTKLVGLLGNPLGHSFSPAMHNRAFQTLGLNFFYMPIEVQPEDLGDVARVISKMNFAGYNITIPHKIRIMEHLDNIDELARVIGAVNTVVLRDGVSTGFNTDGLGYIRSLESEAKMSVKGKTLFILGCGGAARAIAMTLASKDVKRIVLCNRTELKAWNLCVEINTKVRRCCDVIPMDSPDIGKALVDSDVLINTTSIGMHPEEDRIPVSADLVPRGIVVSDIVYNPLMSRLLRVAGDKGCSLVPGLGMLVYQGAEAFRMWTGVEPPVEEMFAHLKSLNN